MDCRRFYSKLLEQVQRRSMKAKPPCDVVGGVRLFARHLQNSSLEFARTLRKVCLRGQRPGFFAKGMPAPANVDEGGVYGQFVVRNKAQNGTMGGDADALSQENDLCPMFAAKRRTDKGTPELYRVAGMESSERLLERAGGMDVRGEDGLFIVRR